MTNVVVAIDEQDEKKKYIDTTYVNDSDVT